MSLFGDGEIMFALVIFLRQNFDSFKLTINKCSKLELSSELWIILVSLVDVNIFVIIQIVGDLNYILNIKMLVNSK